MFVRSGFYNGSTILASLRTMTAELGLGPLRAPSFGFWFVGPPALAEPLISALLAVFYADASLVMF